ncbi:MAG: septal ring lytic transglycosylase RlpA family protein [Pseudomonadota bacterium]|nr:septal ring lytic transglycosylase RlpA family protein [Pseudomonadota bacterium]
MRLSTPSTTHLSALLAALVLLAGCSGPGPTRPTITAPATPATPSIAVEPSDGAPGRQVDINTIPDAVPRSEPYSKYGNPGSYVVFGKTYTPLKGSKGHVERGIASWYGTKFHGRRTSSGEPYNLYDMTAAHKTLPLPTYAQVTNLDNGRSIIVKINDRGPFHEGRIIDLSYVAAMKLDIMKTGTGRVEVRAIDPSAPTAHLAQPATTKTEPVTLATAPAASQNLFLQVGAFSTFSNAENLRSRLSNVATTPIVISKGNQAQPIYRVLIGPLSDDQEAQQLAERLTNVGISQTNLVLN